jgi:benzylsuccinate CoA-transferase BbsF subunit
MDRSRPARGPLAGARILDLSWIIAGPLAARLLADFGAEVIKVESASRIDTGRANRIPLYGTLPGDANSNPDTGGYFQDANAGKLSCTLNLAVHEGQELLRRLAAISDAIICNLGGDQLERWGVGFERLTALNPGIIVVNMPTMASTGPRARWRAFGDMIAAAAGLKSVSGHAGEPPLSFGHQYPDFSSNPFHAAIALMAALHHRDRTGEGQFIEISQYESTIAVMGAAVLEYTANGVTSGPRGNADSEAVPHNIYRCAGEDAWCAITIVTDEQWQSFIAISGLGALRRPEYSTLAGRRQHEAAIDAAIEAWTVGWERQDLAACLQERGVPAGPYQHLPELIHTDPVLSDAHFAQVAHPSGRDFLVHRSPLQAHRTPPAVGRGPLLGEHTFAVLHDLLGLSLGDIAEYSARGAIE